MTIRAVAVQPPLTPSRAGTRGTVFVDARRHRYRWALREIGQGRVLERGVGRNPRLRVRAPVGCLVNARAPSAVAAGNVETSGRIVDVLFRAFGRAIDVPRR